MGKNRKNTKGMTDAKRESRRKNNPAWNSEMDRPDSPEKSPLNSGRSSSPSDSGSSSSSSSRGSSPVPGTVNLAELAKTEAADKAALEKAQNAAKAAATTKAAAQQKLLTNATVTKDLKAYEAELTKAMSTIGLAMVERTTNNGKPINRNDYITAVTNLMMQTITADRDLSKVKQYVSSTEKDNLRAMAEKAVGDAYDQMSGLAYKNKQAKDNSQANRDSKSFITRSGQRLDDYMVQPIKTALTKILNGICRLFGIKVGEAKIIDTAIGAVKKATMSTMKELNPTESKVKEICDKAGKAMLDFFKKGGDEHRFFTFHSKSYANLSAGVLVSHKAAFDQFVKANLKGLSAEDTDKFMSKLTTLGAFDRLAGNVAAGKSLEVGSVVNKLKQELLPNTKASNPKAEAAKAATQGKGV